MMTIWRPDPIEGNPLYLALADEIERAIEDGTLTVGDRLPTHRELASALGVTVGTVTRGYKEAVRRGLIRGEVGRGTFVMPRAPRCSEHLRSEIRPPDRMDLSLNLPLSSEDPDLSPTLRGLADDPMVGQLLQYQPAEGMARHRDAGVAWCRRFGVITDPSRIVVCAGAQHAMAVVLAALSRPGDTILTESLTYPGIRPLARLLQLRLVPVLMDKQGLVPEALAEASRRYRPRCLYTVPTLHNPTNATQPEKRRDAIATILERESIPVLEDDVHGLLLPEAPVPISARIPHLGYYVASMSKAVAGGLRIAFLSSPPSAVERLAQTVGATVFVTSPLSAEIACRWIQDGTAESVLERKRQEALARQSLAHRILGDAVDNSGQTSISSFHAWVRLSETWQSLDFARAADQQGVKVSPADLFWVGSGGAPAFVRLSLGAATTRESLAEGLTILSGLLHERPMPGRSVV